MRRMVRRKRRRIPKTWMMKRPEKRRKMEMRMGRSKMDMQQNDLQRKKRRMKLIQRDRRQKMGLQLEFSVPILFCSIRLSSLHSSLCLHCPFSLWLHTISDEEGLEMHSDREEGMGLGEFPFHPKV